MLSTIEGKVIKVVKYGVWSFSLEKIVWMPSDLMQPLSLELRSRRTPIFKRKKNLHEPAIHNSLFCSGLIIVVSHHNLKIQTIKETF